MKRTVLNSIIIVVVAMAAVSCGNTERKVNSDGVESEKIKVESAILDEYGKLMPGCKNLVTVSVEGVDIADALVYIDEEAGDAYIEEAGVYLAPYLADKKVNMIVSFDEKGGTKEFDVADKLPEPQIRFFNAATNEILDYELENITTVVVELVADDKFAELFPEDSEYRILSFKAILKRGEVEIKNISFKEAYESNQIDISTLQDVAKDGDVIVINVNALQRKNYEGTWLDIDVPAKVKEVTLKLK